MRSFASTALVCCSRTNSVAVFDVLRSAQRSQPFVLLQPRLHLEDILPSTELHKAATHRSLPFDSAFVGIVEETGSLFAMGPDLYPLAIFGDAGVGRLLDAAPRDSHFDDEFGRDQDLPEDLDSVTRRARERRMRKICREGSTDLRCLTGVRRLEAGTQSRFSRLLDAAPSISSPESSADSIVAASSKGSVQVQVALDPEQAVSLSNSVMSAFAVCALALLITFVWLGLRRKAGKPAAAAEPRENGKPVQQELSDAADGENAKGLLQPDSPLRKRTISITSRPSTPRPSTPVKRPPAINLPEPGLELDVDVMDGDESEKDGDTEQPTKRKGVRRKRGKKKRGGTASAGVEDENDEPGEAPIEVDAGKPMVHVVGQSALVVPPPSASTPVEPSLVVSNAVLGKFCRRPPYLYS